MDDADDAPAALALKRDGGLRAEELRLEVESTTRSTLSGVSSTV